MCPWQGRIHRSSAYYTAGVWQHAILIFVKFSVVICIFRRCTFEGHTGCGNFSCLIHVGPTLLDVSKLRFNLLNYSMLMKLSEEEKINGFLASKVKEEGLVIHTALPSQYLLFWLILNLRRAVLSRVDQYQYPIFALSLSATPEGWHQHSGTASGHGQCPSIRW